MREWSFSLDINHVWNFLIVVPSISWGLWTTKGKHIKVSAHNGDYSVSVRPVNSSFFWNTRSVNLWTQRLKIHMKLLTPQDRTSICIVYYIIINVIKNIIRKRKYIYSINWRKPCVLVDSQRANMFWSQINYIFTPLTWAFLIRKPKI